jgi:4-hydroxy-2-oxoheptanedioate aldolase
MMGAQNRPNPVDRGALRARLHAGETLIGTFAGLGSPVAIECCALAGADWILIDLEHGPAGESVVRDGVLAAAAYGVPALVRVESNERIRAGRVLDLGAAGVMVPRVGSSTEAQALTANLRYPPAGDRGVASYNRQGGFGLSASTLRTRNEEVVGIVQIETREGLADVEQIAAIDGVDVLFIGPADLSYAVGTPGDLSSGAFQDALQAVLDAASKSGTTAGIMAADQAAAAAYAARGFRFISIGSDASVLATTFQRAFDAARTSG